VHLQIIKTSKIIKPSSVMDSVFRAQGFSKKVKKDLSYYQLRFKDNITRIYYELQVPFDILYLNKKETYYKIQELILFAKSPLTNQYSVPKAIINAANEKVCEVFSYLETESKEKIN